MLCDVQEGDGPDRPGRGAGGDHVAHKGEYVDVGYNERLDGLQAATLGGKLEHLDTWNDARRRAAARYRELLEPHTRLLEECPETPCVYHLFPPRFEHRDAVAAALRESGIQTGVRYSPAVHAHPAWKDYPIRHGDLPVAEA